MDENNYGSVQSPANGPDDPFPGPGPGVGKSWRPPHSPNRVAHGSPCCYMAAGFFIRHELRDTLRGGAV
eukprot:1975771-Alexandrium_andersonii.AAC.1